MTDAALLLVAADLLRRATCNALHPVERDLWHNERTQLLVEIEKVKTR
jgi:hypothetical protein